MSREAFGRLLCRLGLHDWRICSVNMSGHQSSRSRRCDRCFDNGRLLIETQARGYYGGSVGDPWKVERDERGSVVGGRFTQAAKQPPEERSVTLATEELAETIAGIFDHQNWTWGQLADAREHKPSKFDVMEKIQELLGRISTEPRDRGAAARRGMTTGELLAVVAHEASENPYLGSDKQKQAWDEVKRRADRLVSDGRIVLAFNNPPPYDKHVRVLLDIGEISLPE